MKRLICVCMIIILYYGVLTGARKGSYYLVETKGGNIDNSFVEEPDKNGGQDYTLNEPDMDEEEGPEPYTEAGTGTAENPNLEADIAEPGEAMMGDAGVEMITQHEFENYGV